MQENINLSSLSYDDRIWIAKTAKKLNKELSANISTKDAAISIYTTITDMPANLASKCADSIEFSSNTFSILDEENNADEFPSHIRSRLEALSADLSDAEKITFAALMMAAEDSYVRGSFNDSVYKQLLADAQTKIVEKPTDVVFAEMIEKIVYNPNSAIILSIIGEKNISELVSAIESGEVKAFVDDNVVVPLTTQRERGIVAAVIHAGIISGNITSVKGCSDFTDECGIVSDSVCIATGIETAYAIGSKPIKEISPGLMEKIAKCLETVFAFLVKSVVIVGAIAIATLFTLMPFAFFIASSFSILGAIVVVVSGALNVYFLTKFIQEKIPDAIAEGAVNLIKGLFNGIRSALSVVRQKFTTSINNMVETHQHLQQQTQ